MPRHIFSAAVAWAVKADKSTFWKGYRRGGNKGDIQSPKDSISAVRKSPGIIQRKSEECVPYGFFLVVSYKDFRRDEVQLTKLQQLGMTPNEEAKLLAMRDYIWKLAQAISR